MRCTKCGNRAATLHFNIAENVDGKCNRCLDAEAGRIITAIVVIAVVAAAIVTVLGLASTLRAETPQIMPAGELAALRTILPRVEDDEIAAILADPTTLWYDERSLPPAYLIGGGPQGNQGPLRPADPLRNASRDGRGTEQDKGDGRGGNANVDFPWKMVPGGTNLTPNVRAVKFQWLPKKRDGKPWPIVYGRAVYPHLFNPGDTARGINFTHPRGTVYGELLIQQYRNAAGQVVDLPFELRIRRREISDWAVQVFEPFSTPAEMAAAIKRLRPAWTASPFLLAAVRDLQNDSKELPPDELTKDFPGRLYARQGQIYADDDVRAISLKANVDRLLPLNDDKLVAQLIFDHAWQDTTDSEWRRDCAMPTAAALDDGEVQASYAGLMQLGWVQPEDLDRVSYLNIKPPSYAGPFLAKNQVDCRECHRHTGLSARSFDQGRGWYGLVRGFDEILSWHPFEPESYVGQVQPAPARTGANDWIPAMREEWIAAGMIERFDPAKHPANPNKPEASMYLRLRADR